MPDDYTYTLSEVSQLTGLPKQTLDSWERRYGLLEPVTSSSNRRLYSTRQILRIRLLKRCVERGNRIGALANLSDEQLRDLLHNQIASAVRIDTFMDLVEDMRTHELEAELGLHLLTMGAILFVEELVAPLMQEVGNQWEQGKLPVVAEHLVTASVRSLLVSALRMKSRVNGQQRAIFLTLEDEHHELALLASALLMAGHGVDPVYLGTSVPLRDIPSAAAKTGATAVVIGSTITEPDRLSEKLEDLRAQLPQDISIIIGSKMLHDLPGPIPAGVAALCSLHDLNDYYSHRKSA